MKLTPLYTYSALFCIGSMTANAESDLDDLLSMSLEDLGNLNITSASKRKQNISDIPAAIYVISNERIIRSGAKSIADVLSLAPGIDVSQFNESTDIVSSRGFHDGLFNKMLVMIDGRSVFSPMYGGAFWEDIDYIFTDIDRVEIIRGPSGTIWGGNAVNGVINIITKATEDTVGTYSKISYGQHGYKEASIRHGLKFNTTTTARVFYKGKDHFSVIDNHQEMYTSDEFNTITTQTAGLKFETKQNAHLWTFSVGGEYSEQYYDWFTVDFTQASRTKTDSYKHIESASFYSQISHHVEYYDSEWKTNLWYWNDDDQSPDANGAFQTVDIDTVYTSYFNENITAILGGGLRYIDINLHDSSHFSLSEADAYHRYSNKPNSYDTISNLYTQIDIQLTDNLKTQIGLKVEYFTLNDSVEVSPQIRTLYSLNRNQSLWAGVGRAVVAPSYFEQKSTYYSAYLTEYDDYKYPDGLDIYLPSDNLDNESVVTLDAGYRLIGSNYILDLTTYLSKYKHIRGTDYIDSQVDNNNYEHYYFETNDDYEAKTYGFESSLEWDMSDSIKNYLSFSYMSFTQKRVEGDLTTPNSDDYLDVERQNMLTNQLLWQVTDTLQWDFVFKYKDIKFKDSNIDFEDHYSLDSRIGWKKSRNAPLIELVMKNIGMTSKCELEIYTSTNSCRGYQTEQSLYGRVSYEF
ncbi:TonB-dependent receptor plug domain-containing protein [Aliivibrio fischeri]|uniref:TonB-dependent receptor plug domain-containing protein n=1 Tax=Aliivibrio fischeri TaxID=668 RepID=UPI0009C0A3DD|nr:TonB-dependent receptor [Aliivibrio fischeri]